MSNFVLIGDTVVNVDAISKIDFSDIENLRLRIHLKNKETLNVVGIQTIELLMTLKPSSLESRRLRWHRHVWAFHNLVGHPVMQVLAFFKYYKAAMWVHDITVPRPLGARNDFKKANNG